MTQSNNEVLTNALLEILDNQLRAFDPPETKETYNRLVAEGYPEEQARILLATAIWMEINMMMKEMEPFNRKRFVATLLELPDSLPLEMRTRSW
ncbi:MAG: hypothetical protein RBS57_11310 [Desulforhabdus sp.]|jgi:hypothetical protein|nr:hypothetical protein [Desulforhabdus sp.]